MNSTAPRIDGFSAASSPSSAVPPGAAIRRIVEPAAQRPHILCIPWAGASIDRFFGWRQHLAPGIGMSGVQLPGRGARVQEAAQTSLAVLLDDIAAEFSALAEPPRILFGHSFGALIAYELAMRVNHASPRSGPAPITRLVVSGLSAPTVIAAEKRIAHLDDEEFDAEVHALNGMPRDISNNAELSRYFMKILRDDFRLFESYAFDSTRPPLECPIAVCSGHADPSVSEQGLNAWAALTTGECRRYDFDGDHFFITSHIDAMLKIALDVQPDTVR